MNNELPKLQPVPILLTTYNRVNFLRQTIESINSRTLYPFYLFVVDNHSTDGTGDYLKTAKVNGKLFDFLILTENIGQSKALNEIFAYMESWQEKRPMSDFVISTNDDLLPPKLFPCWLEQMIGIFEKHEKEDGLGALSMRIQRMARADIDESKDVIYWNKGIPSVFRLMRRSDLRQLGDRPFGRLLKWDSNSMADRFKFFLKKRYGFTTHLYSNHLGWCDNRGYGEDKTYFTYAANKENIHEEKKYADIDSETNVPLRINDPCDAVEHKKREDYQALLSGKIKKEITLIIPTYRRPNGLKRIVDSIKKYTTDVLYDLLIVIDGDDVESYQWCLEQNIPCILSSNQREFVAQANMGIYACDTPYFVILADDMSIEQQGWLTEALKVYKERFPDNDGLMAFNDGIQQGRLFATGMSSKKFIYEIGSNLYHPSFIHFGADNVTSFLAKQMDRYYYAESVKVIHHHPTNKNPELANPSDATYKNSEMYNHFDQQLKKQKKSNVELLLKERNYHDYLPK